MSREYTPEEIEAALSGEFPEDHPNAVKETDAEPTEHTPAEEGGEADPEPAEAEADEAPAEDAPDEEAVEEEAPVEDDWEAKAKKIQAAEDREVAQMQKELQQLREEMAERRGREEALKEYQTSSQSAEVEAVTAQDLQDGIAQNLPATFQWTVANRPDLVPELISMVRESEGYGNRVADQMVVEYTNYKEQVQAQLMEERFQQLQQAQEAKEAPLHQRQAMEEVVHGLTERFGENFEAAQGEIAKRMETEGREYIEYLQSEAAKNGEDFTVTPELVREIMVDIYLDIREQSFNAQSSAPAKPAPVPAAAGAIGDSAPGHSTQDDNDEFIASFVKSAVAADMTVDPKFLP